jgi:hypothetical protein
MDICDGLPVSVTRVMFVAGIAFDTVLLQAVVL